MCQVTKCCCCGLRTGTYVIGAFTIAIAVINIALDAYRIYFLTEIYEGVPKEVYIHGVSIVLAVIYFITAILLIIGASQRRKKLLIPWMVMVIIFCVLMAIQVILLIVLVAQGHRGGLVNIIILILEILLEIYCFSVVKSLYKNNCYDFGETPTAKPRDVHYDPVAKTVVA